MLTACLKLSLESHKNLSLMKNSLFEIAISIEVQQKVAYVGLALILNDQCYTNLGITLG